MTAPRVLPILTLDARDLVQVIGCSYAQAKLLMRKQIIPSFKLGGARVTYIDSLRKALEALDPACAEGLDDNLAAIAAARAGADGPKAEPALRLVRHSA